MSMIQIESLSYGYGKKEILKKISLEIEGNQLTGIIGPNGSGKSTLIKNMIKYLEGDYTSLKILGNSLQELKPKKLSQLISYIPQKTAVIPNISVQEFILLGRFPLLKNHWDFYKASDYTVVEEKIRLLGIEDLKDRKTESLSGGELQKVLLAKALVQESKILLLDEPTSALDLNNAVEFMKILKNSCCSNQITPIVVIHDLNLASLFCDSLVVLKEGKLIAKGSPQKVITPENIKNIYNLNCNVFYNQNGKPYIVPVL